MEGERPKIHAECDGRRRVLEPTSMRAVARARGDMERGGERDMVGENFGEGKCFGQGDKR